MKQLSGIAWKSKRSSEKIRLEVPPDRYDNNCMMNKAEVSEQIQEDIMAYVDGIHCLSVSGMNSEIVDNLCQIVVDNFKKLDDQQNHPCA